MVLVLVWMLSGLDKLWSGLMLSLNSVSSSSSSVLHGDPSILLVDERLIQEVVESVVVTLPELPPPKPSAEAPPSQATPPKPSAALPAPQTPSGAEGRRKPEPPAELPEVPAALPAERGDQRRTLVDMCVRALFLCLGRFPQHYKSLYRLAYFYTNSRSHQVSSTSRHQGAPSAWDPALYALFPTMPFCGIVTNRRVKQKVNVCCLVQVSLTRWPLGVLRLQRIGPAAGVAT